MSRSLCFGLTCLVFLLTGCMCDPKKGNDRASIDCSVNDAPAPANDAVATSRGEAVAISPLLNDTDPQGDSPRLASHTEPASGVLADADAGWTYTPNAGFVGSDTFTYEVVDACGATASAEVVVTVAAGSVPEPGSSKEFRIIAPTRPIGNPRPRIEWEASEGAVSYELTVASDPDCASLLPGKTVVTTTKAKPEEPLAIGSYYGCVAAVDAEGKAVLAKNQGFAFSVKVTEGTRLWQTVADFPATDSQYSNLDASVVDSDGNLIVGGTGSKLAGPDSGKSWWIRKFSPAGAEVAGTSIIGPDVGIGNIAGMAIDASDNLYVAGSSIKVPAPNLYKWVLKKYSAAGVEDVSGWNKSFQVGATGLPKSIVTDGIWVYVAGTSGSGTNVEVRKYSAAGVEVADWDANLGLDGNDRGGYLALSSDGHVYLATSGTNLVDASSSSDWSVRKITPAGALVWTQNLGGDDYDEVTSIAVGPGSEVYVGGMGTHLASPTSGQDRWIVKLSAAGATAWEVVYTNSTTSDGPVRALAVDPVDGSLYAGGAGRPDTGTFTDDRWIRKFSSDGTEVTAGWDKKFVRAGTETLATFALDASRNLYAAGDGDNLVSTTSTYDWWIKKFGANGTEVTTGWDKTLDHFVRNESRALACAVDSKGNVYVTGYALKLAPGSTLKDGWLKRFDADGSPAPAWDKVYSSGVHEQASAVAIDADDAVYVGIASPPWAGWDLKKYGADGVEDTSGWNKSYDDVEGTRIDTIQIGGDDVYVVGSLVDANLTTVEGRIRKFKRDGTEITVGWDKHLDAGGIDDLTLAALDKNGFLYVGANLPIAHVWKFAPDGQEVVGGWDKDLGTAANETLAALSVDSLGRVYAFGSGDDMVTPSSNKDLWVRGFEGSGTVLAAFDDVAIDVDSADHARAALAHPFGGLYLAAEARRPGASDFDWILKKLEDDGTEDADIWNLAIDGNHGDDAPQAMCAAPNGDLYVVGRGEDIQGPPVSPDAFWVQRFAGP